MGYQPRPSGGSITDPDVAYIRSDGNDTTGDGSPSAPYLTIQAASDAGFTRFDIGVVNAGNLAFADANAHTLYFRGIGGGSIVGNITNTGGGLISVTDTGGQSVVINTINTVPSATGQAGGAITVVNVEASTITANGSVHPGAGGTGGNGGTITLSGICAVSSLTSDGGESTGGGGTGGNGGNITINGPSIIVTSVSVAGGAGDTPGTAGALTITQGGKVPTPAPDAANVLGAIINNVWHDNSYP